MIVGPIVCEVVCIDSMIFSVSDIIVLSVDSTTWSTTEQPCAL